MTRINNATPAVIGSIEPDEPEAESMAHSGQADPIPDLGSNGDKPAGSGRALMVVPAPTPNSSFDYSVLTDDTAAVARAAAGRMRTILQTVQFGVGGGAVQEQQRPAQVDQSQLLPQRLGNPVVQLSAVLQAIQSLIKQGAQTDLLQALRGRIDGGQVGIDCRIVLALILVFRVIDLEAGLVVAVIRPRHGDVAGTRLGRDIARRNRRLWCRGPTAGAHQQQKDSQGAVERRIE